MSNVHHDFIITYLIDNVVVRIFQSKMTAFQIKSIKSIIYPTVVDVNVIEMGE